MKKIAFAVATAAAISIALTAVPAFAHHPFACGVRLEEARDADGDRDKGRVDEPPCARIH